MRLLRHDAGRRYGGKEMPVVPGLGLERLADQLLVGFNFRSACQIIYFVTVQPKQMQYIRRCLQ